MNLTINEIKRHPDSIKKGRPRRPFLIESFRMTMRKCHLVFSAIFFPGSPSAATESVTGPASRVLLSMTVAVPL